MDHVRYGTLDQSPSTRGTEGCLITQIFELAERGFVAMRYDATTSTLTLVNKLTDDSRAGLSTTERFALCGFFGTKLDQPERVVAPYIAQGVVWTVYRNTIRDLKQEGLITPKGWGTRIAAFCLFAPLAALLVWAIVSETHEGNTALVVMIAIAVAIVAGVALCMPRAWKLQPAGKAEFTARRQLLRENRSSLSAALALGDDLGVWWEKNRHVPDWLTIEPSGDGENALAAVIVKLQGAFLHQQNDSLLSRH